MGLSVLLTIVGYGIALASVGVEPFGSKSMIVMDLQSQYAPFLSYVHQVLTGHGSLLFAWPALGSNFIGNFTYYTASPITLLVALFPASMASPLIEIVVVLKAALTAAAMCWFLLSLGPRRRLAAAVFATAYALMAFSVVYSINIMWLDAAYLLPLLCVCVDRMIAGRSRLPLALVLVYTMLTCFYAGYSAILFGALYLLARVAMSDGAADVRRRLLLTGATSYAALCAVAAAVAAVLLLPTLIALQRRPPQVALPHGLWPWHPGPVQLLGQQVSSPFVSIRYDGLPNISVGIAVVVFGAMFLLAPVVPRRVRGVWAALLGFVALSLCVPFLTWAWQGFGETNWYLYRFSFVYSFVLVTVGFLGADAVAGTRRPPLGAVRCAIAAAVGVAVVAAAATGRHGPFAAALAVDAVLCVAIPAAVAASGYKMRGRLSAVLAATALVVVAADAVAAGALSMHGRAHAWPFRPVASWSADTSFAPAAALADRVAGPSGRVVLLPRRSDNDPLLFGFRGIAYSTTFSNANTFAALHALGLTLQPVGHNSVQPTGSNPLSNAVLGVRSVVAPYPLHSANLQLVGVRAANATVAYVYRQGGAAPLGYLASGQVLHLSTPTLAPSEDPFAFGERMLDAPAGSLAAPAPVSRVLHSNIDQVGQTLTLTDRSRPGVLTWTVQVQRPGTLYAHVGTDSYAGLFLRRGGRDFGYPELENNGVCDLGGSRTRPVSISLVIPPGAPKVVLDDVRFATIDQQRVNQVVDRLSGLHDAQTKGRSLSGSLDADRPGVLVVSVAFDSGWSATVDGHPAPVRAVAGAFVGILVPAGHHRLLLTYRPTGLSAGMAVSSIGVALLVAFAVLERRRLKRAAVAVVSGSSGTAVGCRSRHPATWR